MRVAPRCSLPDCHRAAAFRIDVGAEPYYASFRLYACAFDRLAVLHTAEAEWDWAEWGDL